MTTGFTIKRQFQQQRDEAERRQPLTCVPIALDLERIPRIARLMALAIRFGNVLQSQDTICQADIAKVGRVSRARVTQLLNLSCLAPDIQEQLLDLSSSMQGRNCISERILRPIAAEPSWRTQRKMWGPLRNRNDASLSKKSRYDFHVKSTICDSR